MFRLSGEKLHNVKRFEQLIEMRFINVLYYYYYTSNVRPDSWRGRARLCIGINIIICTVFEDMYKSKRTNFR